VAFSIAHHWRRRLSPEGRAWVVVGELSGGFILPEEGLVFISEEEVFGEKGRVAKAPRPSAPPLSSFEDLEVGDYLVHVDYGIGLYRGLSRIEFEGEKKEFLLIEYEGGDRLYVPIERLDLVHKYFGPREEPPRLDRLGSASWRRAKRRAKRAAEEIARELIEIYAARKAFEGFAFSPRDAYYQEFEATFPYEETPDQWQAIEDVMRDMESPRPMDRLICGDVGFGKTEVAIRAAFKAVMDGKQVALLVPTTVLAQQHYQTFSARFQGYPIVVEMLSRFRSPRRQKEILEGLREGKVDVVIGTHRLLQKDVRFRDLGLLIIDEEQRFGVAHKERLKELKKTVDCLTLTATPIPRTLQMSLVGIREMSLISTPPPARQTISTRVLPFDPRIVREAIIKEVRRGGQVFFVHNRVKEIQEVARRLQELVPEVRIGIAHGQMRERELERVMLRFVRGEIDLLVCTSIIESGLDIPNANTIIINRADRFGLADLYQLRGRVGRSAKKAYAYLLVPPRKELTASSAKRLRAIQELSELGSGFRLALRDLEIRGAGNLLGHRQSGHIAEVGLELYNALLEEAIRELKGEEVPKKPTPEIHIPIEAYIPEEYVEEEAQRLGLYKRLSLVEGEEELEELKEEIRDRFGPPPAEVRNLFEVIELKIWLQRYRVQRLEMKAGELRLLLSDGRVAPERLVRAVEESKGKARLTPSGELILEVGGMGWRESIEEAKTFLQRLS
ncbi:MAG: transcription-repair coupling factor, partial [Deltaproteobacteria bacterium]